VNPSSKTGSKQRDRKLLVCQGSDRERGSKGKGPEIPGTGERRNLGKVVKATRGVHTKNQKQRVGTEKKKKLQNVPRKKQKKRGGNEHDSVTTPAPQTRGRGFQEFTR